MSDGEASQAAEIDRVCDRFERAWRDGQRPRIETYLAEAPGVSRAELLRELLAAELELRHGGERPTPSEYHERFPDDAALVAAAFDRNRNNGGPQAGGARPPQAPDAPDHQLLVGLLALQNGLIQQGQLVAAFHAWTCDKARTLADHLVALGHLNAAQRSAIEALATLHVEKHGDTEHSLAALAPLGNVRTDLESLADDELKPSLAIVATDAMARGSSVDETISISVGVPSSRGTRFQVLRPLSQGGMGVVSVALDAELDRTIALKEIRQGAADNREYRARFLAEAEITSKLEHPGIIPIYGLGTYGDGRPFYAMRLIRGEKTGSLMDAIERFYKEPEPESGIVEFQGLLRRFLDVCNALAYAHSKGVLHRDLKPANILLGPYGETLVVDWGLATAAGLAEPVASEDGEPVRLKLSGSEITPTQPGSAFGTPEYAPPEQMTGDLPNVGPRSDVYGLGAILYCLMTGRAPFSRKDIDMGSLIRKVETGDFPPPRQVRPGLDKALEAICLKAMRTKPADRYESVRALATDLEQYLAEEPVSAYVEPWAARARRWARKHRTLVSSSMAALAVALLGLAAITAVQTKARNDLSAKNGELTAANNSLDRQKKRAEDREIQAIEAVKKFRDAIINETELRNNPALEGLRKRLLKEPLAFFRALRDRLQADSDTRPESLARLAVASRNLGLLTSDIGDKEDALIAYRESLAIFQKLAGDQHAASVFRHELAGSHDDVGNVLRDTGKPAEALKAHESALVILQKLADANPTDIQLQTELAISYNNIGTLLSDISKPAEALKAHESALAIRRKLVDANPTDADSQRNFAFSHDNISILLREAGKTDEALKAQESALAIRRKLVDANPTVANFRGDLARSYNVMGLLLNDAAKPAEALKASESALAILQMLADANPTVIQFQSGLARTYLLIGDLQTRNREPAKAQEACDSALAILQKLADANPTVPQFQSGLATAHHGIGNQLRSTGRTVEALKSFESALLIRRRLVLEQPWSADFAFQLGGTLHDIAMIDLDAKRFEEARVKLREAIGWERKALSLHPMHPAYRRFLAGNLTGLAIAARGLGDAASVAEAERELAKLRDSDPAVVALDARLAAIIMGDQQPRDQADRLTLALRAHEKALYTTAARLWAEALATDPRLGDDRGAQHPYNAACDAVLAGCGQGKDDPAPDEAARAELRKQALGWLNAELKAWERVLMTAAPGAKKSVADTLTYWKQDPDVVGIREPNELAKLPEAERAAFRTLWADVDGLMTKAGVGK